MRGFVITAKGIEKTASMEIKELINADCSAEESCIIFNFKDLSDLCLLCYKCQSADRVNYLIGTFEFGNFFECLEEFIKSTEFDEFTSKVKKFKIECIRIGIHNFNSVNVETKTANLILKKINGNRAKVDLNDYEIIFLLYVVNNKCYFGVDFAGFGLNKRSYKIFLHPNSLRGTIAYALIRESGFKKDEIMLDPFSRDGIIAIEAALYAADFPVNYYKKDKFAFLKFDIGMDFDEFFKKIDKKIKKAKTGIHCYDHLYKYVDYSRKNAKIAGVDKQISFSRTELEWLDIKFKKEGVERIIASPPLSNNLNLDKVYNEFFYQCEYILAKEGTIALISRRPDFIKKQAEKYNFIIAKEVDVWSGEQLLRIIVFNKIR